MRTLLSTVAAILLLGALVVQSQAPNEKGGGKGGGKGKGGGFVPKNLQVLDRATFPAAMQSFVQAWACWIREGATTAMSRTAPPTKRCRR